MLSGRRLLVVVLGVQTLVYLRKTGKCSHENNSYNLQSKILAGAKPGIFDLDIMHIQFELQALLVEYEVKACCKEQYGGRIDEKH